MRKILSLEKELLGEACGIFAGDGGLYATERSCVLEVRGNKSELHYYINYVKPIFERVLSRRLKIVKRYYPGGHVIGIRACGRETMRIFSVFLEFPVGRKSHNLKIPQLILNNSEYWRAYVRGLFDTKGSLYLRKTGKKYRSPVIDITSRSIKHLTQLREIMRDLKFNFWLERRNFKIRMSGWKNVERFFKEIKPHNNTRQKKFKEIMLGRLSWVSRK